ncbi:hypothetical protein [Salinisphaera sp. PC39]|uniref:hypothetical protein n=1 Tax=Salinisphaera sp. PC39 TaxID=1304156 RepID=UPI0033400FA7
MGDRSRHSIGGVRRFAVIDDIPAAFYPSYDIALLAGEQVRLQSLLAEVDRGDRPDFRAQCRHARVWFGARVQRWLESGMPVPAGMPAEPDLEAIEPRILRRNGVALARYVAAGVDGGDDEPFYDALIARYLRAVHGRPVARPGVRATLEPLHESLALRRLWAGVPSPRVSVYENADPGWRGLDRAGAVAILRRYARLYRGPGPVPPSPFEAEAARAKWRRFCRRAILLPGLEPDRLFDIAAILWRDAAIGYDLEVGQDGPRLRHRLLHLAQWHLARAPS